MFGGVLVTASNAQDEASGTVSYNGTTQDAQSRSEVFSPGAFRYDYKAEITSAGGGLWLARTGFPDPRKARDVRAQVLRYRDGRWKQVGGRVRVSNPGIYVAARSTASGRAVPCVGLTRKGMGIKIRCYQRGRWHGKPVAKPLRRLILQGLEPRGNSLVALFARPQGKKFKVQVARLKKGRFVPFGKPILRSGTVLAKLGQATSRTRFSGIDVLLENLNDGTRQLMTLTRGRWSGSPSLPLSAGPQTSGSVRDKDTIFVPVNETFEADGTEWTTSVYRLDGGAWSQVGGSPVSVKEKGSAQGRISAVGNQVWVTWNQIHFNNFLGSQLPTRYYAAKIDPTGREIEKTLLLWKGKSIGPGSTQAVRLKGRPAFLYMRQFGPKDFLHATVDLSRR